MSSTTLKYYKLGKNPSLFADAKSGLKIVKGVPGAVAKEKVKGNKKIREAEAQGHIVSITEDQYDKMMKKAKKTHGKGMDKTQKPKSPKKTGLKKKTSKKSEKPLKRMNLEDLEVEVESLEDITEDKVADSTQINEIVDKVKKQITG